MKKYIYLVLSAVLMTLSLQSCVDEEGPGTPAPKSMFMEKSEYAVDMTKADGSLVLRWIDVQNATYVVTLSNSTNETVTTLSNTVTAGELSTLSMTIPYSQIQDYITNAGLEVDENNQIQVLLNVTGTPIDTSLASGLDASGSTVSATVTVSYTDSDDE